MLPWWPLATLRLLWLVPASPGLDAHLPRRQQRSESTRSLTAETVGELTATVNGGAGVRLSSPVTRSCDGRRPPGESGDRRGESWGESRDRSHLVALMAQRGRGSSSRLVSGSMRSIHVGDGGLAKMAVDGLRKVGGQEVLDLSGRALMTLPPEITQLTNLQILNLSGTQLTTLPPQITQLTNLHTLHLRRTRLATLPPEITRLTKLQTLDLSDNRLTTLPRQVTQLTNLQTLDLSDNQLTTLPPEIIRLTKLHTLHLRLARLTTLPPEIIRLTKLQTLDLSDNQLTTLPPEITRLAKLQTLDLSDNRLTTLPPEITRLTNFHTLHLRHSQLTDLPPEITRLAKLQTLDLSDNRLTTLPSELAPLLKNGLTLDLSGNPLLNPLRELIGRGSDALAAYLVSLEDVVEQFEAKVLLVGEGNVGKTSLVASLLGAPFVENRETTHGIEIHPLILRHPNQDVDMTIWTWDSGGQEVYRITHQFFFSRRALYLMVWNSPEGQEQNEVEGWLRRIRLRVGSECRAIVVATHSDERQPELDFPQLQRTLPGMLAGQCAIDNLSGNGIDQLRKMIADEAARLPQMGQLLSRRWIAAREEIGALAESEPQIPYEQFVSLCTRCGVTGDQVGTLVNLLHDLGQVIYYGDDEGLRDLVVLNPEWLTKAISHVLEDPGDTTGARSPRSCPFEGHLAGTAGRIGISDTLSPLLSASDGEVRRLLPYGERRRPKSGCATRSA